MVVVKYIKYLWLLAFVIVLGTSCKKEVSSPSEVESVSKKADIRWGLPGTSTPPSTIDYDQGLDQSDWGYPYNPNVFPHNTGVCNCGMFSNCHPSTYTVARYDYSDEMYHLQMYLVKPGQVKFPEGAVFAP